MKQRARLLMLVFVVGILTFGTMYTQAGASFSDVKASAWYKGDLDFIVADSRKILSGFPDGTYRPTENLSIDQFVKCVVVAAGHRIEPNREGYWAKPYLDKAMEEGYLDIYMAEIVMRGNFKQAITRGQMADIVAKVLVNLEKPTFTKSMQIENSLSDFENIESTYRQGITRSYELGILTGYPDGSFKHTNTLTRQEATAVIRRIIDKEARKPFVGQTIQYEDHFLGGRLWVDPRTASDEENIRIDQSLIESEKFFYGSDGTDPGELDYFATLVKYNEFEYPEDQLNDLRRILRRRLTESETNMIMDFVDDKTGWWEFLPEEKKVFTFGDVEIKVQDNISFKSTPAKLSDNFQLQLWIRK